MQLCLLFLVIFFFSTFFLSDAVPAMPASADKKLLNGQASYRPFSLYDLPIVSNHEVKADLAVVSSVEVADDQMAGYEMPKATGAEIPSSSDMFVVNGPEETKEQPADNFKPIGVAPKFTGSFRTNGNVQPAVAESGRPIINPAAYFLEGADLAKVSKPKCRMIGCEGPVANDEDFLLQQTPELAASNSQCHQTFVPMNGCTDGKGYPVGMVCTICCDCSADLSHELTKSRGFKEGYKADA